MVRSKKGAFEMQFNWIFVLIAGAIILTFFVVLVARQKGVAETKTRIVVVRGLESIITGAKVSTGSAISSTLPIGDIMFECGSYSVGDIPRELKEMTVFAPDFLRGKQIVAMAVDWSVPFRVSNFLYITSSQMRYIIVDNKANPNKNFIYNTLNSQINDLEDLNRKVFEKIDPKAPGDKVTDKNNYKVKFIYFADDESDTLDPIYDANLKNEDKDVTAIKIVPGGIGSVEGWSTGTIYFYEKDGDSWDSKGESPYYGAAALYGAIFAEDKALYDCVMEKEFGKLNRVAKILKVRSEKLVNEVYSTNVPLGSDPNADCENFHNNAVNELGYLEDIEYGSSIAANMELYSSNLEGNNKQAESKSCVLIY